MPFLVPRRCARARPSRQCGPVLGLRLGLAQAAGFGGDLFGGERPRRLPCWYAAIRL
ncbi:hypothetical protein ACFQZ4_39345 [Catellatospora coxensis]